jgi:hypothetical protein
VPKFSCFQDKVSTGGSNRGAGNNSITSGGCSGYEPPDVLPTIITVPAVKGSSPTVSGHFAIWFATCAQPETFTNPTRLRKPYIISSGFNPGNGLQLTPYNVQPNDLNVNVNGLDVFLDISIAWRGLDYESYNGNFNKSFDISDWNACHYNYSYIFKQGGSNGNQYLDRLRDEGYDVIILTYDNGVDFIENNAAILKQLIKQINTEKMANGFFFENVVSGYSAGAVTSRLALAEMEADFRADPVNNPHPHTKLWVSVEGEMQGCNVPLGFQNLLDFQAASTNLLTSFWFNGLQVTADFINYEIAQIAKSFAENPTANELTLFTTQAPTGPTNDRQNLLSTFSGLNSSNGYPEFARRVGVAQGTGLGTQNTHPTNTMFDSQLKFDPFGNSYYDTQDPCLGTYVVQEPVAIKTTTARWWETGGGNIFDGNTTIDNSWTWCKRHCIGSIHTPIGWVCLCAGPYNIGTNTILGNVHIPQPSASVSNNWDNVPGSVLDTHDQLFDESAYGHYSSWFLGNSFCNHDATLHAFAPTVSTLDLHDPANPTNPLDNFQAPVTNLNLMFNRKDPITGVPLPQQNRRWGFPFLNFSNPRNVTPFDAVYAIGDNNGTFANGLTTPGNQFHVMEAQTGIGDYLARVEVAPTDLYLSNRMVGSDLVNPCPTPGSCYTAEFEARDNILIGNGIYGINPGTDPNWQQNNLTPDGDFGVVNNAKVIIHSGNVIGLLPGVSITAGGEMDVTIKSYNCANLLFRTANNNQNGGGGIASGGNIATNGAELQPMQDAVSATQKTTAIKVYPNPSAGTISIERESEEPINITISDLNGKIVYTGTVTGSGVNNLDISTVQNGAYLLQAGSNKFKLVVVK